MQVDAAEAPAMLPYLPIEQLMQDDDPADDVYVPTMQLLHAVAPVPAYCPARHVEHELDKLAPVALE